MEKIELQSKLEEIINDIIKPILKANNFKKSGRNFYKYIDQFGLCFNIQSSLYNTSDEIRFTFNMGIFIPYAYEIYYNQPCPKFPKEYDCINRRRIEELTKANGDWFVLNKDTEIDEIKRLIEDIMLNYVLSYFERYKQINEILLDLYSQLKIKGNPQHICQLAIALIQNGYKEKGIDLFKEHYKNATNDFYRSRLRSISERISLSLS